MGGWKKEVQNLTKKIWLRCIDPNITLSSAHITGSENLLADRMSRERSIDKEWQFNTDNLRQISDI